MNSLDHSSADTLTPNDRFVRRAILGKGDSQLDEERREDENDERGEEEITRIHPEEDDNSLDE